MDCTLDIEVCSDWVLNGKKKDAWQLLSTTHNTPNIFLTIDWLKLWWEVYAQENDELQLIYIWKNNEIISIIPFYIQDKKIVRFIGTGESESDEVCSEYLDVLIKRGDRELALSSIIKCLEKFLAKGFFFEFNNILEDSDVLFIVKSSEFNMTSTITPVGSRYAIHLPVSFQEYENSCSKSFISQAKRKMRKFKKLGGEIIEVNSQSDLAYVFKKLADLHNSCWIEKGHAGAFSSEKFKAFHYTFASKMLDKGCLSMKALKLNGIIVGVIYNFIFYEEKAFYQMGIDSNITQNISIGTLLHLLEIESSINNKHRLYDFMKGDELSSYKSAYTNNKTAMFNVRIDKKSLKAYLVKGTEKVKNLIKKLKD